MGMMQKPVELVGPGDISRIRRANDRQYEVWPGRNAIGAESLAKVFLALFQPHIGCRVRSTVKSNCRVDEKPLRRRGGIFRITLKKTADRCYRFADIRNHIGYSFL